MKLYHYTDAAALKSILEKGQMWLTDIRYLNDSNEYIEGEQVITNVFHEKARARVDATSDEVLRRLETVLKSSSRSYTLIGSFSRGCDLLSQWRGYCPREGGYSLEFDTPDLKQFGMPLQECVYEERRKLQLASSLFDLACSTVASGQRSGLDRLYLTLWSNIAKFKNAGFSEEDEVRAVVFQTEHKDKVQFRSRGSQLVPYLPVSFDLRKLTGIVIGPCGCPSENAESLRRFLRHLAKDPNHGLSGIALPEVRNSSITFRA